MQIMSDNALEHHLKIEQKLIHLMLKHRDAVEEILDAGYSPEYFDPNHQRIVEAIFQEHLQSNGKRVLSRDTYRSKLIESGVKGDIQKHLTVWELCFIKAYCKYDDLGFLKTQFREAYVARRVTELLQRYGNEIKKSGIYGAARSLTDSLESVLTETETKSSVFASLSELKEEFLENLETLRNDDSAVVECGIPEIDEAIPVGFAPMQITLFVADVGSHKSNMMLNLAMNFYERGFSVLFIPLEMNRFDLIRRMICNRANLPLINLTRPRQLSQEEYDKTKKAIEECTLWYENNSRFTILDGSERTTVSKLKREIEKRAFSFKPQVVIIDYIANMEADRRYGQRNDLEIGDILKSLRFLGKKYQFHVISAAQMGRSAIRAMKEKASSGAMPDSTSIRGSHEYSADADTIFALMKDADNPDRLKVYVLKARHAASGYTTELSVNPAHYRIESMVNTGLLTEKADVDLLTHELDIPKAVAFQELDFDVVPTETQPKEAISEVDMEGVGL